MPSKRDTRSTQHIVFPNGNVARAISLSPEAQIQDLPSLLHIPPFSHLIMLAGGAEDMENMPRNIANLFIEGIALLAATYNALIIDGGTQSGVMELMGLGAAAQEYKFPLLGVAPAELVSYPGQTENIRQEECSPLDPNHLYFALVHTKQWGGETMTMYELAQLFSHDHSSVAILVNGGDVAIQEALHNVRQRRPIIVLQGSGRAADEIALLWQEKPAMIADPDYPDYAEIIRHGNIHLFPATGSASDLIGLTLHLLRSLDK